LEIGQELARAAKVEKNTAKKKAATPLEAALDASPRIDAFARATVDEGYAWFEKLTLTGRAAEVARDIIPEIRERLRFLREVGLGYLNLGRGVTTLSGGEAQRIRLAAQLGSNLSGVLYVLDEPTIGFHATRRLDFRFGPRRGRQGRACGGHRDVGRTSTPPGIDHGAMPTAEDASGP
jgi:excinuclease UvrABC ATPase subunit